jgi:hypothetical protein
MRILLTPLLLVPLAGCQKGAKHADSAASSTSPAATPQQVAIAGTVALDASVATADVDNLSPGGAVPGATVFLKGAPEQAVKADVTGAFTIALSVPPTNLADQSYDLVVWYTTPAQSHRFGTLKSVIADGTPVNVGEVALSYTRRAAFVLEDPHGNAIANYADGQTCTVAFPGFDGKINIASADGGLTGSYIPPATYQVSVACVGYAPLTTNVVITPVTNFNDIQTVSLGLTPN